ncbi:MAG TPA: hypothetical protein VJT09_12025 [Pyrinomonadaceae bacterium]|nr:hypothetical protein [Pyrinomonadaceae bacterium]
MIALLFLAGSALLGLGLVRRVAGRLLNHAEQLLWGLVVGWALTTAIAYMVARVVGDLTFSSILALTILVWIATLALWFRRLKRWREIDFALRPARLHDKAGLLIVLLLFTPLYLELFWTRMLQRGAGGVYSGGGSTWFDLNLHLAISTSFLYGQNYPPVYTPFPSAPLLYPFLPDFQTAILVRAGLDFHAALFTTGVLLALCITGLFYSLAHRLVEQILDEGTAGAVAAKMPQAGAAEKLRSARVQVGAALATLLFLFNGGFGFLYFFGDWRASGRGLFDFWSHLEINYANMEARGIHWTNLIVDGLLPQRTLLFGLALSLICCTLFAVAWQEGKEKRLRWYGWHRLLEAGAVAGALPYFHTHSYIAICFIGTALWLSRPRRAWLLFFIPALALALPQLVSLATHVGQSFVRWQPGWRGHGLGNWPLYWLSNIGLPLILIVPAWLIAPRGWRIFYLAFVALLVFSLLVVVSPNDYDNIKLMYYWHAATSILIAALLVRLANVHRQRILAALLVLASIASGVLALQHERLSHRLLFSDEEMAAASFAREGTSPRALFLTAPAFNQPILCLAGRRVLRANTDWLWSHGYEFREREADIKMIYAGGEEALALLRYYGIQFVYLSTRERDELRASQDFFERNFAAVYRSENISIYDTRRPTGAERAEAINDSGSVFAGGPREFAARVGKDPFQLLTEFRSAGYTLYLYYKVSFNRMPRYEEFMEDMKTLGRGVFVGRDGWEQALENSKSALLRAWTERAEFKALYDGAGDEQFVDALYSNARVAPSGQERAGAIAALKGGHQSRAETVRRIAENRELAGREYEPAYVLMHYFGYLRRDPDDPPDGNLSGFNFWLGGLHETNDYRGLSRAFLESNEYKDQIKKEPPR